jgi:hypothetical protein
MKSLIMSILLVGLGSFSYAQERKGNESIKPEELPEVVIKNVGKDFSAYVPDNNPDLFVKNLQDKFVAYNLGKDYEGYNDYLVVMKGDKGKLSATYNENGKLVSVVEKYDNVRLPNEVIYNVYTQFPGWEFINDKFLYTQKDGDVLKKQYQIQIRKAGEIRNLTVHPDGEIISEVKVANR